MKRAVFSLLLLACQKTASQRTPVVTSVSPAAVCNALSSEITVEGSNFDPIPVNTLRSDEGVRIPSVALDVELENTVWIDNSRMKATVAAGHATGTFDVSVSNPLGPTATLMAALLVVPPPTLTSIAPASGANDTTTHVTLTGTGFRPNIAAHLAKGGVEVALVNLHLLSDTQLEADVPSGAAIGAWDVVVHNDEGCEASLPGGFVVAPPGAVHVSLVEPAFADNVSATLITITGSGFAEVPSVFLRLSGMETRLLRATFISSTTVTALVPAGSQVGTFDLIVRNPESSPGEGVLLQSFRITATPVPHITYVTTDFFTAQQTIDTVACGKNLAVGATTTDLFAVGSSGGTALTVSAAPSGACVPGLSAIRLQSAGMFAAGNYGVHARAAADPTLITDYFAISVVEPSGNLQSLTPLSGGQLRNARRGAAGVSMRNDVGQRFFYALGGDAPSGNTAGLSAAAAANARADAEVSPVVFDRQAKQLSLGAFRDNQSALPSARFGAACAAVQATAHAAVFVLGGGAATVHRALMLRENDAPVILDSTSAANAPSGLAKGSYYYRVAARKDALDAYDPGGETLPSDELPYVLGSSGKVSLRFKRAAVVLPSGPTYMPSSFLIYRGSSSGGELLLEELAVGAAGLSCDGADVCTYIDDGTRSLGTKTPQPSGGLGNFVDLSSSAAGTNLSRSGAQATFVSAPTGNRRGFIYLTGGSANASTAISEIARYEVSDALTLSNAAIAVSGATDASFFHSATLDTSAAAPRLYLMFGRQGAALSDHIVRYTVQTSDGALQSEAAENFASKEVAGGLGFAANGELFFTLGIDSPSALNTDTKDGKITGSGDLQSWSSSGFTTQSRRYLPAVAPVGPYVFAVGGYGCDAGSCSSQATSRGADRLSFIP